MIKDSMNRNRKCKSGLLRPSPRCFVLLRGGPPWSSAGALCFFFLLLLLLLLSLVLYLMLAFCSFPGQLVSVNIPLLCRSWSASQCFVFYCVFSFGLAGEWLCGWWSDWGGVAVDGGGGVCGGTCNFVDNGLWWTTHVARCILHKLSCAMFINNNRTLFHLWWKGNLENMKKTKNIITVIVPNTCIQWIIRSFKHSCRCCYWGRFS